jgi:hypothetical protein
MEEHYKYGFTVSSSLGVSSQSAILSDDVCLDDPEYTDHRVCSHCREIKIGDIPYDDLLEPGEKLKIDEFGLTLLVDPGSSYYDDEEDCPMCRRLHSIKMYKGRTWLPFSLRTTQFLKDPRNPIFVPNISGSGTWASKNGNSGLFRAQKVGEQYDRNLAKIWIDTCVKYHALCGSDRSGIQGMHLIDCETGEIVKADESSHWVALSYVWGPDLPTEPAQDLPDETNNSLVPSDPGFTIRRLPSDIPATVKDAMAVTLDLGYHYLWCDAYCIKQQDNAHKADQISKMDQIYQGAEFTIVATGPDKYHGLHGVGTVRKSSYEEVQFQGRNIFFTAADPTEELRNSPWAYRAWTFQEGYLSKRLLVFTENQMSFYCDTASWMEALGGPEHTNQPVEFEWPKILPFSVSSADSDPLQTFTSLAAQYTTRSLTKDTDSLNAFSGIMHSFGETKFPVLHLKGLPYVPLVTDEVWTKERYMCDALSWYHHDNFRRREGFPCE